jgi:hypothetical protein
MGQTATPTRHNRTITVDFHDETTYFVLVAMGCPRISSTDLDDLTCKLLEEADLQCVKCPATP